MAIGVFILAIINIAFLVIATKDHPPKWAKYYPFLVLVYMAWHYGFSNMPKDPYDNERGVYLLVSTVALYIVHRLLQSKNQSVYIVPTIGGVCMIVCIMMPFFMLINYGKEFHILG